STHRRPTTTLPASAPRTSYSSATSRSSTAPPPPEFYTLSLHDALPISSSAGAWGRSRCSSMKAAFGGRRSPPSRPPSRLPRPQRSEEHTSELQSRGHLVCRLLLEKKKGSAGFLRPTSSSCRSGEPTETA